jgi:UDP-2,3-diacylglucosamine hydrolase
MHATEPIGLIAGWGRFPVVFAAKARRMNIPVVCVGIRGLADRRALQPIVQRFYWTRIAAMARPIRIFQREGVRRWTMAGKVHKTIFLSPWKWLTLLPDLRGLRFWYFSRRRDNRDDSLLLHLIHEFESEGLKCQSALDLCPEVLVKPGVPTQRKPTEAEQRDIEFGWTLAKEMGRLDVGQSVAVRDRAVLAVEAIEGTDRAILRAGELCRGGGFVVVKVAKPQQDMRFDVPTVGASTIETIRKAGGRVLAVEAGRTILLDEEATVALADRYGLTIVAR